MTSNAELIITQTKDGTPITIKSKYGDTRTVKVDREWRVELDGREIGSVRYRMLTRERRGKGKRYVYARWQSPGWERQSVAGRGYWLESTSKKAAIQSLVWDASYRESTP